MTTLTIRIEEDLKSMAALQADKLGIPLTLIVKNALRSFVESPRIVIGEPESIIVTPDIQKKMDINQYTFVFYLKKNCLKSKLGLWKWMNLRKRGMPPIGPTKN